MDASTSRFDAEPEQYDPNENMERADFRNLKAGGDDGEGTFGWRKQTRRARKDELEALERERPTEDQMLDPKTRAVTSSTNGKASGRSWKLQSEARSSAQIKSNKSSTWEIKMQKKQEAAAWKRRRDTLREEARLAAKAERDRRQAKRDLKAKNVKKSGLLVQAISAKKIKKMSKKQVSESAIFGPRIHACMLRCLHYPTLFRDACVRTKILRELTASRDLFATFRARVRCGITSRSIACAVQERCPQDSRSLLSGGGRGPWAVARPLLSLEARTPTVISNRRFMRPLVSSSPASAKLPRIQPPLYWTVRKALYKGAALPPGHPFCWGPGVEGEGRAGREGEGWEEAKGKQLVRSDSGWIALLFTRWTARTTGACALRRRRRLRGGACTFRGVSATAFTCATLRSRPRQQHRPALMGAGQAASTPS